MSFERILLLAYTYQIWSFYLFWFKSYSQSERIFLLQTQTQTARRKTWFTLMAFLVVSLHAPLLLKISNNLEPICNNVNMKCSWFVIFRIISVTNTFTAWETYTSNVSLKNLKIIIFPIRLYLTIYSALLSLRNQLPLWSSVKRDRLLFWGSRVLASAEPNFMLSLLYFYIWIEFIELFLYILKLILNCYFKFERNSSCILLPQEVP